MAIDQIPIYLPIFPFFLLDAHGFQLRYSFPTATIQRSPDLQMQCVWLLRS